MPDHRPLTRDNVVEEFRAALPEFVPIYDEWVPYYEDLTPEDVGEDRGGPDMYILSHIIHGPIERILLASARTEEDELLMMRVLDFIDRMMTSDDYLVMDAASTGATELLSRYWQIERYYRVMGEATREQIAIWRHDQPSPN